MTTTQNKQTKKPKQKITTIGKNVEKLEFLNIDARNVKWCSCCGEVWWFLKNFYPLKNYNPKTLLLDLYTKKSNRKEVFKQKPVNKCSSWHYLEEPKGINTPNAHQLINKQNVVYPYNGILFKESNGVLIHAKT